MTAVQKKARQVDPSILDKITDGFTGFLDAIVQIVENAADWGAESITLRFYNDPDGVPCLDFIDDGEGMGSDGRNAYTILGASLARLHADKIGRNGTGRTGGIQQADEIRTVTKASDDGAFAITLTRESMFEAWFVDGGMQLAWDPIALPFRHAIKTTGTVVTWWNLGHGDKRKLVSRKPEIVIDGLAEKLSPHIARRVRVEIADAKGKAETHDLKQRKLRGREIEGEDHNVEQLGDVEYMIYVVEKADRGLDHLMIGGMTPVCTWSQFVSMLLKDRRYADLARSVHAILGHPSVVGLLDIRKLNDYAVNNRKAFNQNLLEDEDFVHALLIYLRRKIVPLIEQELGMRSQEVVTRDDTELMRDIVREIHETLGDGPSTVIKGDIILLDNYNVDVKIGTTYVFNVKNPKEGARYVWDSSDSGGSLNTDIGPRVEYTAERLGLRFRLVVRMMGDAKTTPSSEILINVLEHVPMRFTRYTVHMDQNDQATIRVSDVPDGAYLVWTTNLKDCKLDVQPGRCEAILTSGDIDQAEDIKVADRDNPDEVTVMTVIIEKGYKRKPGNPAPVSDSEFTYEGRRFMLDTTRYQPGPECDENMSDLQVVGTLCVIVLNLQHKAYPEDKPAVRRANALREIQLRVAEAFNPTAPPRLLLSAAALVTARMTVLSQDDG